MVDLSSYGPSLAATNPMEQTNNYLDTARKAGEVRQQNISNDSAQTDLVLKKFGIAKGLISSLLNNPKTGVDDITKDVSGLVAQGMNLGLFTPGQAAEAVTGLPPVTAPKGSLEFQNQ